MLLSSIKDETGARSWILGKVQKDLTGPHHPKGSAQSHRVILSAAKDLGAERDRPVAALRVTRWDGSHWEGLFFTSEPYLNKILW